MMRTTLNIDDDLIRTVRSIADRQNVSLGSVVSSLIRTGLERDTAYRFDNGIPVFEVREDARIITLNDVRSTDDDE